MRIAMVSEHASPLATAGDVDAGGQNVHVAALSRAFARRGHRVVVYTRRDDPSLPRCVPLDRGVDVVHIDAGPAAPIPKDHIYAHVPQFGGELVAEWSRTPPDVAHAHFWMSGLASLRAGRETGVPVAVTFHALGVTKRQWQGDHDTSPSARIGEEATLASSCDRIVATARHEVFELVRMGASRRRIALVPCGVDLDLFRPQGRVATDPPQRCRFRIVCVSRLVERKGIATVIEALAGVPAAELLVVGGPPAEHFHADAEVRRLHDLARSCGVADRVVFTGQLHQSALPPIYRSADVAVCTPWYEPFGMVALEAMACGVPAVVSAVGGLADTVLDGVTGVHVPARDPHALATALVRLLPDAARRREMGRDAALRARLRYGWDTVATQTATAYMVAMQAGERRRRRAG